MTRNWSDRWYVVWEAHFSSAYDDVAIELTERSLFAIAGENLWETIAFRVVEPLANRVAFWENEENEGCFSYSVANAPFQWLWHRRRGRKWRYPVIDDWLREEAPEVLDDFSWKDARDRGHGDVECPRCGWAYLNRWNTDSISAYGACLHCRIREGKYVGGP